jgi:hypothetical protein
MADTERIHQAEAARLSPARGAGAEHICPAADVISRLFSGINPADMQHAQKLGSVWRDILLSISPPFKNDEYAKRDEGELLHSHSRVVDLKRGILLIEADHPGWIQLLQLHQKYILTGLRRKAPELEIRVLSYRLRGQKAEISRGSRNLTRAETETALAKRTAGAKAAGGREKTQQTKTPDAPPELQAVFARLKQAVRDAAKKTPAAPR